MAIKAGMQRMFGTPLLIDTIDDPQMIADLEKAILARRAAEPGIVRSNTGGGWHSDLMLHQWGGDAAQKLIRHAMAIATRNTVDIAAQNGVRAGWAAESWANVNERGGANARHVHGGSYWSAVFYVRVDEGSGGELVLHDPRMPMLAMHAPTLRFRNAGGERLVKLKPTPGLLILFPSWLAHEVEPWDGDGMRISIAINLTATRTRTVGGTLRQGDAAAGAAAVASIPQAPATKDV